MKLLIDANLSWRLARLLKDDFPGIIHVVNAEFPEDASDTSIWDYAKKNGYSIVTNDEDFYLLALNRGVPPNIIILRTGNQSTKYLAQLLLKHRSEIAGFTSQEEYAVLEIY